MAVFTRKPEGEPLPPLAHSRTAGEIDTLIEIRPGRHLAVQIHPGSLNAATTVFLCHGAGGNKYQWRNQWQALRQAGYRIVAWDFPGHGKSPQPKASKTYAGEEFVADYVALVTRYRSAQNYLLAHSYGVLLSLAALPILLEREEGCIQGGLLLGSPSPDTDLAGGSRLFALPAFLLEWQRAKLAKSFRSAAWAPSADPALIDREEAWANRNPMYVFKALVRQAIKLDRQALQTLNLRLVLVSGDNDRVVSFANSQTLAAALPNATVHRITGCGHQIMLERPIETNAYLFDLLQSPTP